MKSNIFKSQLVHDNKGISVAAKAALDAVYLLDLRNIDNIHGIACTFVDLFKSLIDSVKFVAAAMSGQLKIGIGTLTGAIQDAWKIIIDLTGTVNHDEHYQQSIAGMAEHIETIIEVLNIESKAYTAFTSEASRDITKAVQLIEIIIRDLLDCMYALF